MNIYTYQESEEIMGFSLGSVLGSSVGNIAGSLIAYQSAKKSASAAKSINETQLEYNKEAAQNAHQWEVEDLKKAHLNPILSAGGNGANANPMTAVMPDTSGYQTAGTIASQAITTGADALQKMAQANLANAETDFTKGIKTEKGKTEVEQIQNDTKLKGAQIQNLNKDTEYKLALIGATSADKALKEAQASNTWADTSKKNFETTQIQGTPEFHEGRVYNEIPWNKQKYYSRGVTAYKYGNETFKSMTPWAKMHSAKKK